MTTLIKNGTIVTSQRTYKSDLLIENETIKDIAESIPAVNPERWASSAADTPAASMAAHSSAEKLSTTA